MTSRRFIVAVTLATIVVGVGSFAAGLAVLDDGQPDPPPQRDAASATAGPVTSGSPTAAAPPTTVAGITEGPIATPAWVAIVASESSVETARTEARSLAARSHPAGVLRSDDYPSLKPGLWVAYAGPYPTRAAAETAVKALADDGVDGAYVRCAGSDKECKQDG